MFYQSDRNVPKLFKTFVPSILFIYLACFYVDVHRKEVWILRKNTYRCKSKTLHVCSTL